MLFSAQPENSMKINVGSTDRWLRIALGTLLIVAAAAGWIGAWGWIGILPLATGLIRVCPAYSVAGFSTCGSAAQGGKAP
jgi:hypothetical protein